MQLSLCCTSASFRSLRSCTSRASSRTLTRWIVILCKNRILRHQNHQKKGTRHTRAHQDLNLSRFDLKFIDMPEGLKVLLTPIHKGFQNISEYHHMIWISWYSYDIHSISFICLQFSYVFICDSPIFLHVFEKKLCHNSACAQLSQRAPTRPGWKPSRVVSQRHLCWELDQKTSISTEISTNVNMIYCLEIFFLFTWYHLAWSFERTLQFEMGKHKIHKWQQARQLSQLSLVLASQRHAPESEHKPWNSIDSIADIWVNYNISPTWIKAIWGWFPLLTMIPSEVAVRSL